MLRLLGWSLVLAVALPSGVLAQSNARLGRGSHANGAHSDALWLTPGIVFARHPLVSACVGEQCTRVVSRQACSPPACPVSGWRHAVEDRIADVPAWRADRYAAEMDAIQEDAAVVSLLARWRPAPAPEHTWEDPNRDAHLLPGTGRGLDVSLPSWRENQRERLGIELDAAFTTGSFVDDGGVWMGASASVALQFDLGTTAAYGPFDALFFDGAGFGVHAHVLSRLDRAEEDIMVAVGGRVLLSNRVHGSPFRLPTLMGLLLPEMGVLFRTDLVEGAYVMWALPFTMKLADHLALDLRPRVLVTIYPDEAMRPSDVFIGVSLGLSGVDVGAELPALGSGGGWLF